MNNVQPISRAVAAILNNTPAITGEAGWHTATEAQRDTALRRTRFLQPLLDLVGQGVTASVAVRNVMTHLEVGDYPQPYLELARALATKNKHYPSRATIFSWLKAYQEQGKEGLLPSHTGRVRQEYGWEHVAIRLYNIPSKPSYAAVAEQLRDKHGFASATDSRVRSYLKKLPGRLTDNSPARLGKHFHALNRKNYVMRDRSVLEVGEVYEGDGHTVDVYLAHPNTGNTVYRPELTVWIDIRSAYIPGWFISDAESALSTLYALSYALTAHDHVCAWVHIDNGSGYKSKLMSDENTGFYARFNITPTFAIPGNSKGKGLVEGWFRQFRDRHDKFWNDGQDYCGDDQSPDTNRRISDEVKRGKRQLKSLREYTESVKAFIERYNNTPQKGLDNKSPAEIWQQLQRVPVELPAAAVVRPSMMRTVARCMVRLDNRFYEHPALIDYHGRDVQVEYCVVDDAQVWIYDDSQRLICIATLKTKKAWMPTSRLEEARQKREQGRIDRLQKKIDLVRAEEAALFDQRQTLAQLEQYGADDTDALLPAEPERRLTIDLTEE